MSPKYIPFTDDSYAYYQGISLPAPHPFEPFFAPLIAETKALGPISIMLSPPEQLQFLAFITKLKNPKKILEIGTFTGLSALNFALNSADDCRVTTLDISEDWTNIARKHWALSPVSDKIQLILGDSAETLKTIQAQNQRFDLVFIDADKARYKDYYEAALALLNPNGLIILDNTLWKGQLGDASLNSARIKALRDFNSFLQQDKRVLHSVLPLCDGVSLAYKL